MRSFVFIVPAAMWVLSGAAVAGGTWTRHAIDDAPLRGADGVRLADFDGDGRLDICTGWEESGVVRLYLNPGSERVREPWPAVTVGHAGSPEDAVPFDTDGDGTPEIVSCHEGTTRRVLIHRCRPDASAGDRARKRLLDPANWSSSSVEQLGRQQWMFAEPIRVDDHRWALAVGAKGQNASISLVLPPSDPADSQLSQWTTQRLRDVGWTMTLKAVDMDGDGDDDLLYSDRKGDRRAVGWLEQPTNVAQPWTDHQVIERTHEYMYIDGDRDRILIATRDEGVIDLKRDAAEGWVRQWIPNPPQVRFGKAIRRLGASAFVLTANTAADRRLNPQQPGVWLRESAGRWTTIDATTQVKCDRIECLDLDGDGDEDVLTCEERRNLGVVWYENPAIDADDDPGSKGERGGGVGSDR